MILNPTPDQKATLQKVIADIMNQLYPIDQITTLTSDETYLLWDMAVEVQANVKLYANLVFEHYKKLNKPKEDNAQQILMRKIERALNNRGLDITNILDSINEVSVSKGDQT